MEKIESFAQACQYLKEGRIVCFQDQQRCTFCGMRSGMVHICHPQLHYVCSLQEFLAAFDRETFYLYEKQTPMEISEEKDEEYYRWQHK